MLERVGAFLRHHWRHGRLGDDALIPGDLPDHTHADSTQGGALPVGSVTAHDHTAAGQGGDYAWADITGFGPEPAAVSSSTSGTAGAATTASRGDHGHDLGTHAHTGATDGGQVAHGSLSSVTSDQHHAQLHAASHASDGADELAILAEQAANVVLAGPTTGAAADPAFRALVAADIATHNHTAAGEGGDFPWGDITGFGIEPGAVSSSTSGQEGASLTVSRADHNHDLGQHAHAAAASGGQIAYSAITGTPTLDSGTYTPTLTNVSNLDGSTAYLCRYMRVGNIVTVSGYVAANPTAAGATRLGITLPIVSAIATLRDVTGVAACDSVAGQSAAIYGDAVNDRAEMNWIAVDTTNQYMFFVFGYTVI